TLDFLRILPVSGHELVLARKLPAWFLRIYIAGLWSPLYAVSFALLGLPPTSAIPFSLLLGVIGWTEAFSVILLFFLPLPSQISLILLLLFVILWSSVSISKVDEVPTEQRSAFAATFMVLLLLGLIALQFREVRVWRGAFDFFAPHPFYGTDLTPTWAALWLTAAAGWIRVDRLARWLETPKGLRRFYFVPPLFIMLFFTQGFLWGWLQQIRRWQPADCFTACASFSFVLGSILHWLWFNWSWAEKTPPEKPPISWLPEAVAWRLVTIFVPLIGCWRVSLPFSQVDASFLSIWLILSFLDTFSLGLTKSLALRLMAGWKLRGYEFLSSLALVPIAGFLFRFPFLVAFSPSIALLVLGWQPLLSAVNPIKFGNLFSISVPNISFMTAVIAPIVRALILALIWGLMSSLRVSLRFRGRVNFLARFLSLVNLIGEFVFILPAVEKILLARTQNPVFRHMVSVTRWRYGWLPYFAAFVFGLLKPSLSAISFVVFVLAFIPVFWFTTYTTVHNYLRKLHQTGELWQWLITPLPSKTIVNGWRYGGWWWQLRWLGLAMWLSAGGLLGGGISYLPRLSLFLKPVFVIIASLGALIAANMVMGAVPLAIVDALREPRQAFSQHGQRWSKRRAIGLTSLMAVLVAVSVGSCGFLWFVAPIVGLAMSSTSVDPAVRALEQIRKAPMDELPS
ncbi:MAG: hypothetical protein ACK40X_09545, partial [Armatimonadota bacterium]